MELELTFAPDHLRTRRFVAEVFLLHASAAPCEMRAPI